MVSKSTCTDCSGKDRPFPTICGISNWRTDATHAVLAAWKEADVRRQLDGISGIVFCNIASNLHEMGHDTSLEQQ